MSFQMNPEQTRAATNTSPSYAVIASAGAGKTKVLVEKYLHHVVDNGYRPDEILTITFTRKAAAEMKRRIVDRLRELERYEDAQSAETGPISTIHGLCERLLRENALAANVDPRFEVIANPVTDLLFDRALQKTLSSPAADDIFVDRLLTRLSGKSVYRKGPVLEGELKNALSEIVDNLRSSGIGLDRLYDLYESPGRLQEQALRIFAENNPALKRILDHGTEGTNAILALKQTKRSERGDAVFWLDHKIDPAAETAAWNESFALARLALDLWRNLEDQMRQDQTFDFNLLESKAVQIVRDNPEVSIRIRNQYRALLVDETQDVNPVQFELLDKLCLDHQMMVGDPQQSIYWFRGADPTLFADRAHGDGTVTLTKNYRSEEPIIAFVNDFFHEIWQVQYGTMEHPQPSGQKARNYQGVELWEAPNFDSDQTGQGIAEMVEQGTPPSDIAILVDRATHAVDVADALLARNIPSQIHGGSRRFYARMETRDLANALAACANPQDDFSLAALLLSPYVGLSLDSLVIIRGPENRPLAAALAETTLSDEAQETLRRRFLEWFPPLAQIADRVPAWELVSELFHQTDYFANILARPGGQQTFANARKLLTLASQYSNHKAQDYAELIRKIPDFQHRESEPLSFDRHDQAVSIMTIHAAKGLEFPVVVLPDLFYEVGGHIGTAYVDRRFGLIAIKPPNGESSLRSWIAVREKAKLTEEKLRLLYVAMTRARQRLCLAVPAVPPRRRCLAGIVADTLGYPEQVHPSIRVRRPPATAPAPSSPTVD